MHSYPNLYECLFDLCKISTSVTLQFECHKVSQMNVAKQRNYKGLYGDLHGCINLTLEKREKIQQKSHSLTLPPLFICSDCVIPVGCHIIHAQITWHGAHITKVK